MRRTFVRRASGRSVASFLLLAFIVRSLIPAGYMPDADRPFALGICPDGLPVSVGLAAQRGQAANLHRHTQPDGAAQHAGHEHTGAAAQRAGHVHVGQTGEDSAPRGSHATHESWTHCPFAALAGAPMPLYAAAPTQSFQATSLAIPDTDARFVSTTRFRIAQPRAPPVLSV